jgi:hypothetical protein
MDELTKFESTCIAAGEFEVIDTHNPYDIIGGNQNTYIISTYRLSNGEK